MFFSVQQAKKQVFLQVVRAGRVARSRADSLVALCDELGIFQGFVGGVAPEFGPHALVQPFGKCFDQAVGQGLKQEGLVVVVLRLEGLHALGHAVAHGNREQSENVARRVQVVGQTEVGLAGGFFSLLTEPQKPVCSTVGSRDFDVVVVGSGCEKSVHAVGR